MGEVGGRGKAGTIKPPIAVLSSSPCPGPSRTVGQDARRYRQVYFLRRGRSGEWQKENCRGELPQTSDTTWPGPPALQMGKRRPREGLLATQSHSKCHGNW